MNKINAGVTLMQDFCRAESDTFSEYIDYIDREEAQRNAALPKFNLFNEYVGNPYKGSHLFTADRDFLSLSEKQDLKDAFKMAQINGSVMWQTVISFDNAWLEKNGVYHSDKKMLDERKIYEVTRHAMGKLLENENLNNAVWSAGIHYNTDNLHVHIAIVEPYPMRELMLYNGNLEVRGKMKMSNIKACKSVVVNELMQSKEMNQKINFIIRKDIIEKLKERELSNDPELQDKFLVLCQRISMLHGPLNYNNRETTPIRKQVDEISKLFLDRYCPEKYKEFVEIIERQSHLYAEAYGGGNENVYKEDKHYELMQRLGNVILKSAKEYMRNMEGKAKNIEVPARAFHVEKFIRESKKQTEIDSTLAMGMDADIDMIEYEDLQEGDESPFKLHAPHKKAELPEEYKKAEEYLKNFGKGEKRESISESVPESIPESLPESSEQSEPQSEYEQYAEWFGVFKMRRADVNKRLREGKETSEEKIAEFIQEAETNPFLKAYLGEMYLYGKIVEIDLEKAERYFKEALEIFEQDVDFISVEENKFDFKSYLQYRIGKQYVRGWGTQYDPKTAAEWFRKSGTSYASFSLGNLYYEGEGVEQDFQTAFQCYQRAGNNPFANLRVAQMHERGEGIEQDISESETYYEIAFKQFCEAEEKTQDALFEYRLGNMCYYGKGCEKNINQSIFYLKQAVKQKNIPATLLLSKICLEQNITEYIPEIITILEDLSEKGEHETAQYTLGNIYTNDWEFYDLKKGVEQYEKSAEQGNENAQYRLGKLYINPELEVYDLQKGVTYLKEAAEQGNEFAQLKLGIEYIKGKSVDRDLFSAREWLGKSAEQGNEIAKNMLDNLSSSGRPQMPGKLNPMNEFDKALLELRKSLYKAQEETMKNLMVYEQELQAELEMPQGFYI